MPSMPLTEYCQYGASRIQTWLSGRRAVSFQACVPKFKSLSTHSHIKRDMAANALTKVLGSRDRQIIRGVDNRVEKPCLREKKTQKSRQSTDCSDFQTSMHLYSHVHASQTRKHSLVQKQVKKQLSWKPFLFFCFSAAGFLLSFFIYKPHVFIFKMLRYCCV